MKKVKILVCSPEPYDANSLWRALGPMHYMSKASNYDIEIVLADPNKRLTFFDLTPIDILFMHRPCRPNDVVIMQLAHLTHTPVWVEFDDWLFQLPGWNPAQADYAQMGIRHSIATALACADLISVTTEQLAELFKPINPNVVVLPNAYRSDLFPYRTDQIPDREMKKGIWRGSRTHEGDVLSVADGLRDLPYMIHFMGVIQWTVLSHMKRESFNLDGSLDPLIMMQHIWSLKPKVLIAPLVDCLFNRCKSNIAYIEAMHAGAICVAPDMPEWKRPGIINYQPSNPKSFREAMDWAFNISQVEHNQILENGFKAMKAEYDISVVNKKRLECVKYLTAPEFRKNINNPWNEAHGVQTMAYIQKEHLQPKQEVASG